MVGGQALCSFLGPASSWRPGVQTCEPLRDTAHSNHKLHRIGISAVELAAAAALSAVSWSRSTVCESNLVSGSLIPWLLANWNQDPDDNVTPWLVSGADCWSRQHGPHTFQTCLSADWPAELSPSESILNQLILGETTLEYRAQLKEAGLLETAV